MFRFWNFTTIVSFFFLPISVLVFYLDFSCHINRTRFHKKTSIIGDRFCACDWFKWKYWTFAVHTIGNELKDSLRIQSVVQTSLALCSSVYILTSFFGFLLFGDSTQDDVMANFDTDLGIPYSSLLNDLVRITYALHLMLVFPILFHPLRLNVDGLFFPSAMPLVSDNRRFALITVGLISLVYLGANFIPSIWDAFQFTGATAAVCLGFIFPAAIALRWIALPFSGIFHEYCSSKVYPIQTEH